MTYKPREYDSVFAWPSQERTAAIEKVVAATGKEPRDRVELAKSLNAAYVKFVHLNLHGMPRSRTSLKSVRKAVEKAATAINSNSLAKEASKGIADLDKLCSELRRLEAVPKGRRPSLIEYLAGSSLPVIYELEFRTKPTPTRGGSFVKFAGAALEAFGLRCSPETIIKGLTAFRKADGQKTK